MPDVPRLLTPVRPATPGAPTTRVISPLHDHGGPVTEQSLVDRQPDARALDLPSLGLAPQLPRELTHLRDCLRGYGLAEAREAAARVDRHSAAERGLAVADELLRFAGRAQPDLLVPVELHRGRQVVDLCAV